MTKRYPAPLSHKITGTAKMGLCYPASVIETYPGDSFKIEMENLTRFLPQVAPTMHSVNVGFDMYSVPLRQLCDKIGINWDDLLTGGVKGDKNINFPTITVPETGFKTGSLADWLNYPTNYLEFDEDGQSHEVIVAAGEQFSAFPVIAYMHIIQENYLDRNFVEDLDFSKYQEFLEGTYVFKDVDGNPIGENFAELGLFPKAWSRDYFGRALSNTQRGPAVTVPLGQSGLSPDLAMVRTGGRVSYNGPTLYFYAASNDTTGFIVSQTPLQGTPEITYTLAGTLQSGRSFDGVKKTATGVTTYNSTLFMFNGNTYEVVQFVSGGSIAAGTVIVSGGVPAVVNPAVYWLNLDITSSCTVVDGTYADLSGVETSANGRGLELIAFRLASRMQAYGETLQRFGARAVEYTLGMFGVRIPDDRIQRPTFHGSWRLPVVFSEVLQTSQSTNGAPLGQLGGHGITGGKNSPIHIKCIEHGFIICIMHVMPQSQYRQIVPKYLLRKTRWDIPVPMMQGIGEQAIERIEIDPNSRNPHENFGYVPRFSELFYVPSTLHGHMKDTFLHWNMARAYADGHEPLLNAMWRYERPTDRSFNVKNEAQMQLSIGFKIKSRRAFRPNMNPGIHIV